MLTWHFVTQSIYNNIPLSEKSFDKLFFIKDTNNILCGTRKFRDPVVVYKDKPTTYRSGKIYINGDTLEGKIWENNRWTTIIKPAISISNTNTIINNNIKSVIYDASTNKIVINFIDTTNDIIDLDSLFINLVYDNESKNIIIREAYCIMNNGIKINLIDKINIEIENDNIFIFFDNKSCILINNTMYEMNSIYITGNSFIAESMSCSNNNIYKYNNLYIVSNDESNSSAVLLDDIDDNYSAVELAIYQIRTTLESSIGDRMHKVGSGYSGEIIIADDDGDAFPSGIKIGGSKIKDIPSDKLVITEKALVDYVNNNIVNKNSISKSDSMPDSAKDASDEKVASEKTLIKAISWNVI